MISSFFSAFDQFRTMTPIDVVDILVVAYIIYRVMKLLKDTSAARLAKGILILVLIMLFASFLHLTMISWLLRNALSVGVFAVVVIFQPELRRLLEQIGKGNLSRMLIPDTDPDVVESMIVATVSACADMSRTKTGALIVFERKERLGEIIATGTRVDAAPSAELIKNIFFKNSPLHDGAMIVRAGRVCAAGCVLPLSGNQGLSRDLGTRHRAAVGMSETADSVIVVVMDVENPERNMRFDDVPVRIIGASQLKAATGLELIEGEDTTVTVSLRGQSKSVGEVRVSQITATVDISGLTEANEYDLPVTVSVSKSGVETNYVNPGKVHVRVDRVESKDVPVEVNVTGTPDDGYRAGKPTTATKKVTVSGPATDLAQVSKAVAAVDVTGRNSSLADYECKVTLYDQDGAAFTSNYITSQTEKIKVSVPIYRVNNIPLTVTLKDGGSLTQNQVQCVIDPENVEVIASNQAVLSDIKEINLGEIDLGSVHTGTPISMSIKDKLPSGVSLVSGQPETANVTISVDGIATRKVQVSKFAWNDTAQENTPYTVNILTKSVEMELRGSESQLKKVDVNNLSIGLTYDSVSLGVGRHTVKGVATTVGLPSGVTLVEEDIEVEIEITDAHVSDETITSDKTDSTDDTDSTVAEPTAHRTRKGGGSQ